MSQTIIYRLTILADEWREVAGHRNNDVVAIALEQCAGEVYMIIRDELKNSDEIERGTTLVAKIYNEAIRNEANEINRSKISQPNAILSDVTLAAIEELRLARESLEAERLKLDERTQKVDKEIESATERLERLQRVLEILEPGKPDKSGGQNF